MPFRNEEFICKTIREFIERLVSDYKAIIEIWLFGSRAQGKKIANDWDLLVVTMDEGATLSLMEKNMTLKGEAESLRIHLFIHGRDKDPLVDYSCPWERIGSRAIDKLTFRNKISWIEELWFEYSGENGTNTARWVWDREGGSDSFLNEHY